MRIIISIALSVLAISSSAHAGELRDGPAPGQCDSLVSRGWDGRAAIQWSGSDFKRLGECLAAELETDENLRAAIIETIQQAKERREQVTAGQVLQ